MADAGRVTIGIPAYNSVRFLEAAVASALAQDYPDIRIVISVDVSSDDTAALARTLGARHGIEVIEQRRRLGWIGNSNAVLEAMTTPFGMILPHDDVLLPSYVSRCMAALAANETAAVACADLEYIREGWVTPQLELRGPRAERAIACLRDGLSAVSYRGVIRLARMPRRQVPATLDGFAADTVWMLRMALAGEVIRVPEVLYRKNFHKRSTHRAWMRGSRAALDRRWLAHVAEMGLLLLRDAPALLLDRRVREALRDRVHRRGQAHMINTGPIAGWASRFPLLKAQLEYVRRALRMAV